jgi:short-subunit dehydrogenase
MPKMFEVDTRDISPRMGRKLGIALAVGAGALFAAKAIKRSHRRFEFAGKSVLITGGSRGLGLVTARELMKRGARVAICARDAEELKRADDDLRQYGSDILTLVCDVRDTDDVSAMVNDMRQQFGSVDVLINNAGVIQVGPLELQTRKDYEDAMAVHFWGPLNTMLAVIPEMRDRRSGRIVNISSIGGKIAVPHLVPYSASKFALAGLSSGMRSELIRDNVYLTTVYPGLMRTGSHINALFKGQNEKEFAWFSIADSLPLTSVSAETAARQIVKAAANGDAELIISPQAKLAAKFNSLFPEIASDILALSAAMLPNAGGIGARMETGLESPSAASPSVLTMLADSASERNNELKSSESITH